MQLLTRAAPQTLQESSVSLQTTGTQPPANANLIPLKRRVAAIDQP